MFNVGEEMLTRQYPTSNPLTDVQSPTGWQEIKSSFKAGAIEPFLLLPDKTDEMHSSIRNQVQLMEHYQQNPDRGFGIKIGDFLANMAGSALNPLSIVASEVGGSVATKLISGAKLTGRYLPSNITKAVTKPLAEVLPKGTPNFVGKQTAGGVAASLASNYMKAVGFMIPEEIAHTQDPKTHEFNWWGGIKAATTDGAFALGLMPVPYLAGMLFKKIGSEISQKFFDKKGKESNFSEEINRAHSEGSISKESAEWLHDFHNKSDTNENLNKRAVEILKKEGYPVDSHGSKVLLDILSKEDVSNLEKAHMDQIGSNIPDHMKNYISDYIVKNKIDSLKSGVDMTSGIDGVIKFVGNKLDQANTEIEKLGKLLEKNEFTEEVINSRSLSISKQVEELKSRLLKDGSIIDGHKNSEDYHRLVELAEDHQNAHKAFHEVNYHAEVKNQEDLKNFLEMFNSVLKTDFGKMANESDLMTYMKERSSDSTTKVKPEDYKLEPKEITEKNYDIDLLDAPDHVKEEFEQINTKLKEFKKSKKVFDNLIDCVRGSRNGAI